MSTPQAVQEIRKRLIRIGAIASPKPEHVTVPPRYREQTLALYRSLLREAKKVTYDTHVRDYFIQWFRSSFKKNKQVKTTELLRTKRKRAEQELRRLRRVNSGDRLAFGRAISLAYARRGPLRHTLLAKVVEEPSGVTSEPLVPSIPRSIPPPYPPLLKHMLTTPLHIPRPLTPKNLTFPSKTPDRIDPNSEEARLLGPLPKRRERWLRWNHWTNNVSRLKLPVDGVLPADVEKQPLVPWSLPSIGGGTPRIEKLASGFGDDGSHIPRWMRRQYQYLLGDIPIVKWRGLLPWQASNEQAGNKRNSSGTAPDADRKVKAGRYESVTSPVARILDRPSAMHVPTMTEEDRDWVNRAASHDETLKASSRRKRN